MDIYVTSVYKFQKNLCIFRRGLQLLVCKKVNLSERTEEIYFGVHMSFTCGPFQYFPRPETPPYC